MSANGIYVKQHCKLTLTSYFTVFFLSRNAFQTWMIIIFLFQYLMRLTDNEKSKTFLMSSGCDTPPMLLISRTFSSCKSASLNSFMMASSALASPCLRTVLYTADLKSAGIVDSPLQWASNLLRASSIVVGSPLRPITPRTNPLKRASKWPKRCVGTLEDKG